MTNYNKAVALWQSRKISNDAELAEAAPNQRRDGRIRHAFGKLDRDLLHEQQRLADLLVGGPFGLQRLAQRLADGAEPPEVYVKGLCHGLFDRENAGEARDLEDLHDALVHAGERHAALLAHDLLRGEQDAQAGRGDVIQRAEIEHQLLHARQRFLERGVELRRGGGIEPPDDGDVQTVARQFLANIHDLIVPFWVRLECFGNAKRKNARYTITQVVSFLNVF